MTMASFFKKKTVDGKSQAGPKGPSAVPPRRVCGGFGPRFPRPPLGAGLDPGPHR